MRLVDGPFHLEYKMRLTMIFSMKATLLLNLIEMLIESRYIGSSIRLEGRKRMVELICLLEENRFIGNQNIVNNLFI